MKKLLPFLSIVAFFVVACNSAPKDAAVASATAAVPTVPAAQVDTAGLAEYQAWKIENELSDADDFQKPQHAVAVTPVKKNAPKKYRPAAISTNSNSSTSGSANSESSSDAGTISSESGDEAKAEKTGISKAAKGAVIGGVVGAGAGAVINKKNRVVGAVVGGIIGAGGGYVLGRKMDKKDGRY